MSDSLAGSLKREVGSGGRTERVIFVVVGLLLLAMGCVAAWFAYLVFSHPFYDEWRHLKLAAAMGLAFFLLRGGWAAVRPRKKERERFALSNASR